MDDTSPTSDQPVVPKGVIRGIEDIKNGNTASLEEIKSTLNNKSDSDN